MVLLNKIHFIIWSSYLFLLNLITRWFLKFNQKEEISRRQARVRESPTAEQVAKLHAAEAKMQELKANMAVLGKEASAALAAVDAQQQRLTFQRLVAMV